MGYQFAHAETYSRKKTDKKFSVKEILAEARRDEGACPHVPNPAAPDLVYGMALDELEALHDSKCENMKETNKKGITRGIRKDQQTLGTIILSFPAIQENEDPAAYEKDFERWKKLSISWLKNKYGDELKTIIEHTDESNPHLHAYLIPDDLKADKYNIGRCAKKEFMLSPEAQKLDKKEANKLGDRLYRSTWREWQDSYFNEVSVACGLTRIGSHSRRLSRKEKKQEQQQAKALSKALNETSRYVGMKKAEAEAYKEKIIKEAREQADKILKEADAKLSDIKKEIRKQESKLEELTNKPLLQKIFDKFRSQGFKQAERELKESYKSEIDSLNDELKDTREQISKLNQYTLKLTSDLSKKETENNKLIRKVSELDKELSSYKKDIDTSPFIIDTRPDLNI